MSRLWKAVLPVLQEINDYGGNFISIFVNRAVLDEIHRLAGMGDTAMAAACRKLESRARALKGPADHAAFNGFFESYHEALFYILAQRKDVWLRPIPETTYKTPDFETVASPLEAFEIKTIDFAGGALAYGPLMEEGLNLRIYTSEKAAQSGIGTGIQHIRPHGDALNTLDAIIRVMRQIAGNVKHGQFENYSTILVVPMVRTALRTGAQELQDKYLDSALGGEVCGHLWTIAAHRCGERFRDVTPDHSVDDFGPLVQAGILRDFPFVAGLVFIDVTWSELPSSDFAHPFPDSAFHLYGVWNEIYDPPSRVSPVREEDSSFLRLCDGTATLNA